MVRMPKSSGLGRVGRWMAPGRLGLTGLVWLLSVLLASQPVLAQRRSIDLVRDAEIEHILRKFATPIFQQAGIVPEAAEILLVKEDSLNAFVAGGQNMFFHTGLLMGADNVEQLLGVMAHETGHMAGGHLVRAREGMENATILAGLATIIGLAAAIGAGRGEGVGGAVAGGQEMGMRSFFSFTRTQESAADEAGLQYLEGAGITSRGMLEFMEKLNAQRDRIATGVRREVEFLQTHPLTENRIIYIREFVENRSRFTDKPAPAEMAAAFERMKAKLYGFVRPEIALRRYAETDTGIPARYARAIALYQLGSVPKALELVDGLLRDEPENPYFHELRGQILFENGRASESVPSYRKAVAGMPGSGLLRTSLAHALLETGNDKLVPEAIQNLMQAQESERQSALLWRLLASAYSRADMQPQLAYARAEEALARGDIRAARFHADKAEQMLPAGSPEWIRAQDIRVLVESRVNSMQRQ